MYRWLFKNKWVAIAFVILTLVSVQSLVGRNGDEDSAISRTKSQLISQRQQMQHQVDQMSLDQPPQDAVPDQPSDAETTFADDNDLIDDARGFDPTPETEEPLDPSPDQDESSTSTSDGGAYDDTGY